jgi:hypothetical protein
MRIRRLLAPACVLVGAAFIVAPVAIAGTNGGGQPGSGSPAVATLPFCAGQATPVGQPQPITPVSQCFSTKQEMLDWVNGGFQPTN